MIVDSSATTGRPGVERVSDLRGDVQGHVPRLIVPRAAGRSRAAGGAPRVADYRDTRPTRAAGRSRAAGGAPRVADYRDTRPTQ